MVNCVPGALLGAGDTVNKAIIGFQALVELTTSGGDRYKTVIATGTKTTVHRWGFDQWVRLCCRSNAGAKTRRTDRCELGKGGGGGVEEQSRQRD